MSTGPVNYYTPPDVEWEQVRETAHAYAAAHPGESVFAHRHRRG
jgi:hypothetical protein